MWHESYVGPAEKATASLGWMLQDCKLFVLLCIICRTPLRSARVTLHTHPHQCIEKGQAATMGSAALSEAVKSINEWSMSEGRASSSPVKATAVFGSLAFNDKA